MKRPLFAAALFASTALYAGELFIPPKWQSAQGFYTTQKQYCHPVKTRTLCSKNTLSYPLFTPVPDAQTVTVIENLLQKAQEIYAKNDPKYEVFQLLSDGLGDSFLSEVYTQTDITLFSLTPNTLTLRNANSGYSGGAHGFYSVDFQNYTRDGRGPLRLEMLFDKASLSKLKTLAETFYRKTFGLKPNQNLTNDGWFDNTFKLAENVAVTPRGLLFHYNSYEIKPYAAGHTEFLLPAFALRPIIDPKSPLAFYLTSPKTFSTWFQEKEIGKLRVDAEAKCSDDYRVTLTLKSDVYQPKTWLSVSFPQLNNADAISDIQTVGFDHVKRYPARTPVYNIEHKKAVKSRYLLLEADSKIWKENETKQLAFTLKLPKGAKYTDLRIRAVFKRGQEMKTMPNRYNGIKGQQGFGNYQLYLPKPE